MPGTKLGGIHARDANYSRYGRGFYRVIGAKGGSRGRTGGFYGNRELARRAGTIGGTISRRGAAGAKPKRLTSNERKDQEYQKLLERFKNSDMSYLEFMSATQQLK